MLKLKDILKESKVNYLVEKPSKTKKQPKKTGNPALDKEYTLIRKADNSKVKRTGAAIQKLGDQRGKIYKNYPQVIKQIKTAEDKQKQDASQKKSEEERANKIKNTNVKTLDKKSGKKIDVKVDDVLPPPFGSAKELDNNKPGTKEAKKVVYDAKVAEAQEEAKKEVEARKKKNKGKFKLTADEQKEFNAWKEENEFLLDDDVTEEQWFTEQKPREEMSVFNPETGEQWEADEEDWFGDFGDEDDDDDYDWFGDDGGSDTDNYGNKLSKLGSKDQQNALELKMGINVGTLKSVKTQPNHRVTNKDGRPVKVAVFQDPESGKYYGITDEGDIYENDTDDFRDTESKTDARGFAGAVTSDGQKLINKRDGKDTEEDDYDSTSFSDLLNFLGIDTDIDWTNPLAAD